MASETSDIKLEAPTNNNDVADNDTDNKVKLEFESEAEIQSDKSKIKDNAETSTNGRINQDSESTLKRDDDDDNDNDDGDDDGDNNDDGDDVDCGADGDEDGTGQAANEESMDEGDKTNLIVNYLPQQMTDETFKELFTKFGPMKSCKIVRNRLTGYSYGFGFVDFETHEQAMQAIKELNGHELDTKQIKVAFARPAGQDIKQANLYVKNIPPSWGQDDVRKAFESYGNIIQVRVLGNNRGVAFVLYDLRKQAETALESMQGKKLEGAEEPLEIKFAADKKAEKKRTRRGGANRNHNSGDNNGRTRERGNRGGVNRNRNRSQSDTRNRSQTRGPRGNSNQRGGANRQQNSNFNNDTNNGFGPMRQQSNLRMNRFTPFAPVQHPMPQQAAPIYGYPPQQQMYQYMMQQQQQPTMMSLNPSAPTQPMAAAIAPMATYQIPAVTQMAQMAYGAPAAQTMSNMYNMASNTMHNAAQMQPQLGQPMNQMRTGTVGGDGGGGHSSGGSSDGATLFVYNIGPQTDENELRTMFAPYGQVLRCNVVRKTPGGETKGFGFVTLKDTSQANAAISSLNGTPRYGKTLQVSFKK